jgi:hypothetical protein
MFNCFLLRRGWVGRIEHARYNSQDHLSVSSENLFHFTWNLELFSAPHDSSPTDSPNSLTAQPTLSQSGTRVVLTSWKTCCKFQLLLWIKLIQVSLLRMLCKSYCSSAVWNAINSCAGQRVRFTRFLILASLSLLNARRPRCITIRRGLLALFFSLSLSHSHTKSNNYGCSPECVSLIIWRWVSEPVQLTSYFNLRVKKRAINNALVINLPCPNSTFGERNKSSKRARRGNARGSSRRGNWKFFASLLRYTLDFV